MQAHSPASTRLSNVALTGSDRHRVRQLVCAIAAVGLLCTGHVVAQEPEEAASEQAPTAKPGKNGKVCEYEAVTGSRMKKKICFTPEQWEARQRAAKQLTRELDNRSIIGERSD